MVTCLARMMVHHYDFVLCVDMLICGIASAGGACEPAGVTQSLEMRKGNSENHLMGYMLHTCHIYQNVTCNPISTCCVA